MALDHNIDRFQKLSKIGQGSFAEIFFAKDTTDNSLYAMKIAINNNDHDSNTITVVREAMVLQKLRHSNVVQIKGYCSTPEKSLVLTRESASALLVMDFCPFSLGKLLVHPEFHFGVQEIKCIVWQLIVALDYIHQQMVIHGDLRPSNILIASNGIVKLSDFGLAYHPNLPPLHHDWDSHWHDMWYAPPEELLGERYHGSVADIWRLGCIIPEMWTKKPIMEGKNRIDQLARIFELCGSINLDSWPDVINYPFYDPNILPMNCSRNLTTKLQSINIDSTMITMIEDMLKVNPIYRPSSAMSLNRHLDRSDFQPELLKLMLARYSNCTEADIPQPDLEDVDR